MSSNAMTWLWSHQNRWNHSHTYTPCCADITSRHSIAAAAMLFVLYRPVSILHVAAHSIIHRCVCVRSYRSFYLAMLAQSAVMRLHVVCRSVRLSVRLSVTFRYRDQFSRAFGREIIFEEFQPDQIGWNSSKIISRPNSWRPVRSLTPNMATNMATWVDLQRVSDLGARRRLRSLSTSALVALRTVRATIGDRAFPAAAASVWNRVSETVRSSPSLPVFRSTLKTELFARSYSCSD